MLHANNRNRNKSDCFTQGQAFIYPRCFQVVTRSEKEPLEYNAHKNLCKIYKFFSILVGKKAVELLQDFSKLPTRRANIKNMMEWNILLMTESKRFALVKSYLLRR